MKKMINLLFALLLSLSIISCGGGGDSGDSGDSGNPEVKLPGTSGGTDSTPNDPSKDGVKTGTSSSTGCSEAALPGCKA